MLYCNLEWRNAFIYIYIYIYIESFVLLDLTIQPNANEACHIDHIKEACHIDQDVDALVILIYVTCPIYMCNLSYFSVFLGVTRCVPLRDMPHVPVQCASFMCVA